MKKYLFFVILLIIILLAYFRYTPMIEVLNGYAAKKMCSCVFIAGRTENFTNNEELEFSPVRLASVHVDYKTKRTTASVFGLVKREAVYHPTSGCVLLTDEKDNNNHTRSVFCESNADFGCDLIGISRNPSSAKIKDLDAAVGLAFTEPDRKFLRNTRAVIVIKDGIIISEQYAAGFDSTSLHTGWSMSKSLVNAMVGILVKKGLINIEDRVPVSSWQNDARKSITWKNLLQMNSGLKWTEDYGKLSEATQMLYREPDMFNYATSVIQSEQPGKKWYYASGTTNILSGLLGRMMRSDSLKNTVGCSDLFSRTGLNSFKLEYDEAGTFVGSSYSWATARDWARFGMLYLNNGIVCGDTLFTNEWVGFTSTPATGSDGRYGAHFWLNRDQHLKGVPSDLYYAEGYQGQAVFVIPSLNVVVVRLGLTKGHSYDYGEFLRPILMAVMANKKI
jgi:CubicO group peptidase (beta-lactamase class C family)